MASWVAMTEEEFPWRRPACEQVEIPPLGFVCHLLMQFDVSWHTFCGESEVVVVTIVATIPQISV